MKNCILYLILAGVFIVVLGLSAGCAEDNVLKGDLGQEFSLRIGQTARIESEQLSIRFNGILADSRCPKGVTCFWAGEVKCDVTAAYQGVSSNITLMQPGIRQPYPQPYEGYLFIVSVDPYPEADKQISTTDYRLNLTVEKLPPGIH